MTLRLIGTYTADGKEISVYADDQTIAATDEDKIVSWTNLPKFVNGNEITYKVVELKEVDGKITMTGVVYAVTYNTDEGNITLPDELEGETETTGTVSGTVITNKYVPKTEVTVTKVWEDNDDQDGIRPVISAQLYKGDDAEGDPVALNEGNNWTYTWTDLDKYYWTDGETPEAAEYAYTVKEVVGGNEYLDGDEITNPAYKVTIEQADDGSFTFTITNTHEPETEGKREDVTLRLIGTYTADGKEISVYADDQTIAAADEDKIVSWTNLPKFVDGNEITYKVVELKEIDGKITMTDVEYTVTYAEDADITLPAAEEGAEATTVTGTVITNKYVPEIEIHVVKYWNDNNDQDDIRPDGVKVQLYTVTPAVGEGGLATLDPVGEPKDLTEFNSYSETWTGLAKYYWTDGEDPEVKEYEYTVRELADGSPVEHGEDVGDTGYSVYYGEPLTNDNGDFMFEVVNTHEPETKIIRATKAWDDEGYEFLRKDISLTLTGTYEADGVTHVLNIADATKTISKDAETLTVEWADLPVYQEGAEVTYTVTEADIAGYTPTYGTLALNNNGTEEDASDDYYEITVTNTPDLGKLTIDKSVFVDGTDKSADFRDTAFYAKVSVTIGDTTYYVTEDGLSDDDGDAEIFEVYPGTTVTVEDLPVGTYTVTEVTAAGDPVGEGTEPDADMGAMTWLEELSRVSDEDEVEKDGTAATSLVNVYTTGKFCVAVTKQWLVNGEAYVDDDLAVTVKLQRTTDDPADEDAEWADVEGQKNIELNKANNWSYVAIGMDQMDADGFRYHYQWVETPVDGWIEGAKTELQTVTTSDDATLVVLTKLTNSKVEVEIPIQKTVKGNDYEGTFTFTLESDDAYDLDGSEIDNVMPETTELVLADGETGTFGPISYSVPGIYNYVITEDDSAEETGMEYAEAETVTVIVEWNDEENPLYLMASVECEEVPVNADAPVEFINTYTIAKAQPEVEKIVTGNTDAETYDPSEEFTFTLAGADGEEIQTGTIMAGETFTFDEITYTEAGEYFYTITETEGDTEGMTYDTEPKTVKVVVEANEETGALSATVTYGDDEADTLTVTNVYQITTAQPEVEKIVTGNIDAETYDPDEEFTFTLEALGGAPMPEEGTETVNIKADEIGVFGEITYTEAGEYFYTITETEGDTEGMTYDTEAKTVKVEVTADEETGALSATVTYGNDEAEALTVTNVYRIVEVEIPVTKKVDGDTDAPSYDPDEEFTFTLEAQELRAVSDETPMPAEGGETVTIKADEIGTFGAITYYEPGTYAYIITETEGDTVGMSYDTTPTGVFVVVTEDEETGALNASVEALEYEITTITNTYKTGKLEVTKNVTVYGLNGEEDIASAINDKSFMVCVMDEDGNFYAMNGKNLGTDTYWVEITDGVTLTWEHMPFGTYTVIERENIAEETGYTLVTYYTVDAAEPAEGGAVADEPSVVPVDGTITEETPVASFTVENVYTPEKTFVKVVKVWVTSDTTTIPDSLTVYLNATAAGETEETAIILTADDDWTWMSDALPVYNADGQMIIYTWTEEDLPEGYSLTGMEETDLTEGLEGEEELTVIGKITTITNTYTPGMTSVQVTKIWDDADNRDGKRPENIKVQLYVQTPAAEEGAEPDEAAYGDPVTLPIIDGDEEKWTHIWTELPEMIDGVPQTYVVRELDVTEETDPETGEATGSLVLSGKDDATYYVTYKQTGSTWTVTNSYEPEETEVPVIKIWDDFDDADGKRPTSVTVFLYANGEPVARTELNKDNNWTYTFEHLNKYENGTEIEYYVEEYMGVVINEDYTEVEGSPAWNEEDAIWEITNKYEPKTEVTVTKVWNDADDKDGLRPDISVQLYRDGEAFGEAVELNEGNDWTANWSDLDKYWWKTEGEGESATKTATAYVYTVKEVVGEAEYEDGGRILVFGTEEDGLFYNVAIADNEDGTFTITNTYEPETVEIEIVKVWDDAEDQDGIRPDHIDVKGPHRREAAGRRRVREDDPHRGEQRRRVDLDRERSAEVRGRQGDQVHLRGV